jgi:hypothetical protein
MYFRTRLWAEARSCGPLLDFFHPAGFLVPPNRSTGNGVAPLAGLSIARPAPDYRRRRGALITIVLGLILSWRHPLLHASKSQLAAT